MSRVEAVASEGDAGGRLVLDCEGEVEYRGLSTDQQTAIQWVMQGRHVFLTGVVGPDSL